MDVSWLGPSHSSDSSLGMTYRSYSEAPLFPAFELQTSFPVEVYHDVNFILICEVIRLGSTP